MCTHDDGRDPWLPDRLLRTERDLLMPLLRRTPEEAYELRTACPGWTARQVLAHCGAALVRIVEDRLEEGVFLPEANACDVAEREDWPLGRILDELERGLTEAGPVIAAREDGRLDAVALGEWVHAGDVREAFGEPGAYCGKALELALPLLTVTSRKRETPRLVGVLEDGTLPRVSLGNEIAGRPPAVFKGDASTLIRIYAGRPLVRTRYELSGATEQELLIYR
ncbi:maleylpyruvate isomerase family mycothiol-dependent enzyme [Streptomyces sp. TX20-6-3]|uniref:maleylpyruvate isomerase family mycothiol-dependent enzyme n=1 Tax=Streptomyces sp. TX20-6-3 TaxID=3028705 RepID=UPI0029B23298|nr:maleylpyruvate isomerase family mycothiol-dependent enzyme [Streptomyces sp. TX20-6-3]MDX2560211.1 maleylpyruvate isomerase family mycothiol-dependent enzyme [Streptomyces sp. TX20-6-3]